MEQGRYIEIEVPEGKERERLDKFLTHYLKNVSRARLQKLIQAEKVLVDGTPAKASYLVSPFEKIELYIPRAERTDIQPEAIPLNVVYEDEHLLVLNKEAGMVVHPAFGNYRGTLVNALLHHCGDLSSVGGRQRPGIVHRLDKDTSGLLVVAKNDLAHHHLAKQFSQKSAEREYHALVWGHFKKRTGRIETYIGRSTRDPTRMTVQKDGKLAVTNYQVLEELPLLSYIKLMLETGRTHQIRVHLAHVQHPVFGDLTYGGRNRQLGALSNQDRQFAAELLHMMPRQALHAKTLGFVHPATEEFMLFDSELPGDMKQLLAHLRSRKS